MAIVGAFGSGKSSVAQAGLLPRLRDPRSGTVWTVLTMNPGADPAERLAEILAECFALPPSEDDGEVVGIRRSLVSKGDDEKGALARHLRRIVKRSPGIDRVLLFVDQFEEAFTLRTDAQAAATERVLDESRLAARGSRPRRARHGRSDAAGGPVPPRHEPARPGRSVQGRAGPCRTARARGAAPGDRGAREGARRPPRGRLVERILADLGDEAGALPLLEYALDLLWRRRDLVSGALTHAAYDAFGGVRRAIAARANEIYAGLAPDQQAAARIVLLRLVRPGEGTLDSKRPARIDAPDPAAESAIAALAQNRLIVATEGRIEITHEALIREWDTLRAWVDAAREDLSLRQRLDGEAEHWEAVRRGDPDAAETLLLAPGLRLEEGRKLLAGDDHLLDGCPTIRTFVERSLAADGERVARRTARVEAERAREQAAVAAERRRARWGATAAMAAAVVFALLCGVSVWQWREAEAQREDADVQRRIAQQRTKESKAARGISEQQTAIAVSQTRIAEERTAEAERQRVEAERQRAEASRQATTAEEQRRAAQRGEEEARRQTDMAEAATVRAARALSLGIGMANALIFDLQQKFADFGVPLPVRQAILERALKLQRDLAAERTVHRSSTAASQPPSPNSGTCWWPATTSRVR